MAVSVFYYEAEPVGGYPNDALLAYYFDAHSMTVRKPDHPDVIAFLAAGGSVSPYQTPAVPPTVDAIDQATLNAALASEGSVVRALALVLLQEINTVRTRLPTPLAAYTQAQLVATLKAKMR